jgi:hypothetical protein
VQVRTAVAAPASTVWSIVADPHSYSAWVCGTVAIRGADTGWPRPGARLHHVFGPWPLRVHDHTTMLSARPGRCAEMQACARPLGVVRAVVRIDPAPHGSMVCLREDAIGGWLLRWPRIGWLVQRLRNRLSIRRLGRLSEVAVRPSHRRG